MSNHVVVAADCSYLGLDGSRPALAEACADATWENIPLPLDPLAYGSPVVVDGEQVGEIVMRP
ncbi:hypothetical protein L195_g030595 [Trifolium pratense]|uniref:Uncharacterized protein n=1 Tax=Trifolium pratense TaxID=57577 RepID=A0A2K3L820_TRIPR|nr:hypothetical protein L195_g030595 [Trifolium pratense]